jgi:isoleucyl-tRNA synthetase|uniref:isoleucine--tRNA ligase n=1 Tax=viral metagenome TaxID=1070528 RepID=A0A6C0IWW7_9ZZZZ
MSEDKRDATLWERVVMEKWTDSSTEADMSFGSHIYDRIDELHVGLPKHVLYDGPPFATGSMHYGHACVGIYKDIDTRFHSMNSFDVSRKIGWDTHGIPVENIANHELGITSKSDVYEMGIGKYNNKCEEIIKTCESDWSKKTERLARWVNSRGAYHTCDPEYMESVWWTFAELYKKDLVYHGMKICPYSTGLGTPLSNSEAKDGYRLTLDTSICVGVQIQKHELKPESAFILDVPEVYLVVWTTTIWTLPSNMSVCVNPDINYILIRDKKTELFLIIGENGIKTIYTKKELKKNPYEIITKFSGECLVGLRYTPLFGDPDRTLFVCGDSYVTDKSGTGVVHMAPAHGIDDYRVCVTNGVIERDGSDMLCFVNDGGCFREDITDMDNKLSIIIGRYFKDTENEIVSLIKEMGRGEIIRLSQCEHDYPFCPRTKTPLIYKPVNGWFVNIQKIKTRMIELNDAVRWHPEHIGSGRFLNWLKNAEDWCISRDRFWGTPIPIWTDGDEHFECIGSIEELCSRMCIKSDTTDLVKILQEKLINDLHRESIDEITILSKDGTKKLHRIPYVLDCWFESGSMPWAQHHYPFENVKKFECEFPADFVCEGLDQTRGWFYSLMALSTAIFNKAPYRNVMVSGIIVGKDGKKLSKSDKNYTDLSDILERYGAEPLRFRAVNSGLSKAQSVTISESSLQDATRDVILQLANSLNFMTEHGLAFKSVNGVGITEKKIEMRSMTSGLPITDQMDIWILCETKRWHACMQHALRTYEYSTLGKHILEFIKTLNTQYIRLNYQRLKGRSSDPKSWHSSLLTLCYVLHDLAITIAPVLPFMAEHIFQRLKEHFMPDLEVSVHCCLYEMLFCKNQNKKSPVTIERFISMDELGKKTRGTILSGSEDTTYSLGIMDCGRLSPKYIDQLAEDLQLLELRIIPLHKYKNIVCEPNLSVIGKHMKKDTKDAIKIISKLSQKDLLDFRERGYFAGFMGDRLITIMSSYVRFSIELNIDLIISDELFGDVAGDDLIWKTCPTTGRTFIMDVRQNDKTKRSMIERELVQIIQRTRQKAGIRIMDPIWIFYEFSADLMPFVDSCKLAERTRVSFYNGVAPDGCHIITEKCGVVERPWIVDGSYNIRICNDVTDEMLKKYSEYIYE